MISSSMNANSEEDCSMGNGATQNKNEIRIGAATYQITRSFSGTETVQELLLQRILQDRTEETSVAALNKATSP